MHSIYINLDRRTDRRDEFEREILPYGIAVERFTAIEHEEGIVGCGKSHLAVLKRAKMENWPEVLIFEDDFQFLVTPEKFHEVLDTLKTEEFDVCMLAYNLHQIQTYCKDKGLGKVRFAQTASAYIVRQHYYDTLIELYEWAIPQLETTRMHWVYANDIVWRDLQEHDTWLYVLERIGRQRPGYSDNAKSYQDHDC